MTSRSPRGIYLPVTHFASIVHSDLSDDLTVCFEVLSCFFDHPSIDSTKKMPLHLFGKDVLMFCPIKPLSASIRSFQQMLLSPGGGLPYETDGDARRKFGI